MNWKLSAHCLCRGYFHRPKACVWSPTARQKIKRKKENSNHRKAFGLPPNECKIDESAWNFCRRSYQNNASYRVNFLFLRSHTKQRELMKGKPIAAHRVSRTRQILSESPKVNGNFEIEAHFSFVLICFFFSTFFFPSSSTLFSFILCACAFFSLHTCPTFVQYTLKYRAITTNYFYKRSWTKEEKKASNFSYAFSMFTWFDNDPFKYFKISLFFVTVQICFSKTRKKKSKIWPKKNTYNDWLFVCLWHINDRRLAISVLKFRNWRQTTGNRFAFNGIISKSVFQGKESSRLQSSCRINIFSMIFFFVDFRLVSNFG